MRFKTGFTIFLWVLIVVGSGCAIYQAGFILSHYHLFFMPMTVSASQDVKRDKGIDGDNAPWIHYGYTQFPDTKTKNYEDFKKKIAIIIVNVGEDEEVLNKIFALPSEISVSFLPFTSNLQSWVKMFFLGAHEVFLDLPLGGDEAVDLGRSSVDLKDSNATKIYKINKILGNREYFVGLTNWHGQSFLANHYSRDLLMKNLLSQGFVFFENSSQASMLCSKDQLLMSSNIILDQVMDEAAIRSALNALYQWSSESCVIGVLHAYPLSVNVLADWLLLKPQDVTLVPMTYFLRHKGDI